MNFRRVFQMKNEGAEIDDDVVIAEELRKKAALMKELLKEIKDELAAVAGK